MSGGLDIYGQWKFGRSDTKKRTGIHLAGTEVKKNLAVTTVFVTACFLSLFILEILYGQEDKRRFLDLVSVFCVGTNRKCTVAVFSYRKEYREALSLQAYLEAFENGEYEFQGTENGVELGIRSQIIEQLERLGRAFCVIEEQLIEEKEETNELVTDISHQIKTPISAIHMSLELLQDTQTTEAENKNFWIGRKGSKS